MYEYFKGMQAYAEWLGEIENVKVYTNDEIFGNRIKLSGTTQKGSKFELELNVIKAGDTNA